MTAEFTKICLRKIAENPDYPIISVSMNDSDKLVPCECAACSAVIKEDNASGLYLRFVNQVAAGIREKYPHMLVQTLAYHETLVPPKKTVPADTVLMAVGMKPRRAQALQFAHLCPETSFYIIGDAVKSGEIRDAVFQAFEVTRTI